ncbi:MAG: toll/interleukin-1 receptor domain-containing protein [Methanosarcinales archaeon]
MGTIFIAYSSEDMRFLTNLGKQLRPRTNHEIWIAKEAIDVGKEWRKEIEDMLNQADFFVPLISKSFLARPEPRRELSGAIDLADQKKLKIIPIIIEELKHEELPIFVRATQYIPYQPFDSMLDELLKALSSEINPLSSKAAFEQYVDSMELKPEEMVKLGEQVLTTMWPIRSEMSKAAKYAADKLKNQGYLDEALYLYSLIVNFSPSTDALRVARAKINLQLRNYQSADDDCAEVLKWNPTNVWALHQRFWINHEWALSKPSRQESEQQRSTMKESLQTLQNAPSAFSTLFLTASILALAKGAIICEQTDFAISAKKAIDLYNAQLSKSNRHKDRIAILKAMRTLEQFYQNMGDTDTADNLRSQRTEFEDRWKRYSY